MRTTSIAIVLATWAVSGQTFAQGFESETVTRACEQKHPTSSFDQYACVDTQRAAFDNFVDFKRTLDSDTNNLLVPAFNECARNSPGDWIDGRRCIDRQMASLGRIAEFNALYGPLDQVDPIPMRALIFCLGQFNTDFNLAERCISPTMARLRKEAGE